MDRNDWVEGAIAVLGAFVVIAAVVTTVAFGIFVTSWSWYFLKQILPP